MNILAFHVSHDASAALVRDGRLELAVAEEKFSNIKSHRGLPLEAMTWLLDEAGLVPGDIDAVVHAGQIYPGRLHGPGFDVAPLPGPLRRVYEAAEYRWFGSPALRALRPLRQRLQGGRAEAGRTELREVLAQQFGFAADRVRFVEHHACHAEAVAGFYGDDGRDWVVLTMDAAGDADFASVSRLRGGRIERLSQTAWEHSLGWMYTRTTEFLGMRRGQHEYKVMGLAAYPHPEQYADTLRDVFAGVAWLRPGTLEFDSRVPMHRFDRYLRENAVGRRFDHVAAGLQACLEELVVEWVRRAVAETGIANVMTSGGVFMNVKLNKRLQELEEVERIRFMPSCGDETNPIGAAFHVAAAMGDVCVPTETMYLGPRYTPEEVRAFVDREGLRDRYAVREVADPEAEIAELLAGHAVVGRVAGRAELGARALGHRSILANASDLRSFYEVNDHIKARDFWMPFAPAILDEDAARYLREPPPDGAAYMITAFDSTAEARDDLRAAMHQGDHTLRPQLVTEDADPRMHRLLEQFKARTGLGGVLNTSLNIHGYPLAATLEQALFTFENSGLRHLMLEDVLVSAT
ncbi:MAG: carbamoyltransferase [Solirubrobacterales bacterium]|nr:carbamoyltransferase [Solirubrobacterales bacterium]